MHHPPEPEHAAVREERLSCGLRVVTDRVPSVESVTLGILVEAGSRDDPEDAAGLAHFIEHAIFKGTGRRSYLDIARDIERNGGYLDAWTTKEHTCIYVRCLSRHMEAAFELLSDLVTDPVFPAGEIEKEKEVVLEEIASIEDTPEEMVFDEFDLRSFPRHPLGRPILGTEESVEGLTEGHLTAFMREHYRPSKMILTATGDVRHDLIMRLAERFLARTEEVPPTAQRIPFRTEDYRPFRKTLKKRISQSQIVLGTAVPRNDELFYAAMALNSMLGGGMSSLVNLELREKRGLAYTAYSSVSFYDDLTTLNIYTGTDATKIGTALELIEKLLRGPALTDPDPLEVETARNKLLGSHIMGMEKMTRRMSQVATDISYFGRYLTPEEKTAAIEAVTPEAVARAARALVQEAPLSTLIYRPSR
ncbi:pitrilysin family protein [Chlorobium sp. N1]|uniref:M16 family metallopeptidase n=1 Tax=Chlorobium sp. N1 TaxID=2491138 RepID=UPI00103C34CF|nr:pitrilysin family protein [Chlorobium sp. N1]TCD47852.1 insulinase family protein [Chlorobium sp. N1]